MVKPLTGRARMVTICLLLAFSMIAAGWLYFVKDSTVFFFGLFYLPVILACLWWGRRGIWLTGLLSLFLLLLHLIEPGITSVWEDLLHILSLFLAGLVVGEMSERQHRLMQRIVRQGRELEEFNHTVSHDLKGPLTTVGGFAEAALDASLRGDDDLCRECINGVIRSAGRMRESIDSLLALAESGAPGAASPATDANAVVEEVLQDYAADIFDSGAKIAFAGGLPEVSADPARLKQVFANLVSNALKYGRPDVPLRLEIGCLPEDGGEAVFFVRDNGKGMEPESLNEVFAPFKRLDHTAASGSGLGLSIAHSAVDRWGGRIWAESEPGRGSTFYFSAGLSAQEQAR